MVQPLIKSVAVPQNVQQSPYDPVIPLLGIYSRELKIYIHTKKPVHKCSLKAFLITAKKVETICPSINQWINKMWYINTMQYYLAI